MSGIQWAPRVAPKKVLQLYQTDARGIRDEELIDDVGYGLLARCESIRIVSEAYGGKVECPQCASLIVDDGKGHRDKEYLLACKECGWEMRWGAFFKTYQGKQLRGQNFEPEFRHFLEHFPRASAPAEKMRLIDRLIHAVHKGTAKPAATNLLSGKAGQLGRFLNELAYGEGTTEGLRKTKADWDDKLDGSGYWRNRRIEICLSR